MSDFKVSKPKDPAEIQRMLGDAWLNINVDASTLYNPMETIPAVWEDTPELYFTWLMSRPEYFSFVCKEVFNIQLLPMQALILKEMWNRKFPMLIGARGLGKMLVPNEKIRIKNGWTTINNIKIGDKVYGSDGKLTNVTNKTNLQYGEFYKITLRDGRIIECCEDHQWKVWDKYNNRDRTKVKYSVLTTKKMFENYFCIRKDSKSNISNKLTKEYRYALPINKPLVDENKQNYIIHPYIVGVLLGDGSVTHNSISFTTNDQEIVDRINKIFDEEGGYYKVRKRQSSKFEYGIVKNSKEALTFHRLCKKIGIFGHNSHTKFIPDEYKYGSCEQKLELIRGLMDTDGYSDGKTVIEYYTVSNKLSDDFLDVARSIGLSCKHTTKESWFNGDRYADCNRISIYTKEPIFTLKRKLRYINHTVSKQGQSKYEKSFIINIEYIGKKEGMCIAVDNEDSTYITKDYIVTHNSFLLGLYSLLRIVFMRQRKVVIVGAAFRQSKVIFEYMETIWNNAPVLRSMCPESSGPKHEQDMWRFFIGDSVASALPLGDGSKIRGQRANDILNDEFASTPREIFENVVAGFGSVSASPIDNVMTMASELLAEQMGIEIDRNEDTTYHKSNQIILSGTAYYDFNHFAEYWKDWSAIIRTKGDPKRIQAFFNKKGGNKKIEETEVPNDFNWTDYSVIRVPYELIPLGFMDAGQVARSRATIHTGIYEMEYGAVFSSDSNGFYKRSLIETCVGTPNEPISLPSGEVYFGAMIRGNPAMKYVYGIDPASEVDNFTIVIMEAHPDHHRIVYVWSTTRKDHREKVKSKLIQETDFYSYCCRQIRDLMKKFPCEKIALDAQGGGIAVIEGLHDQDKIKAGELPIWPTIDPDKEKDTDGESGLHIVEMIQFASADWTSEANHGLRKDFEDKVTLFPHFDGLELSVAANKDILMGRLYDTLEDCMLDIEELKDELSTILISETPSGREKWDTPEIKLPGNKKGRQRKDRYSALLMANMVARQLVRETVFQMATTDGGFAGNVAVDDGQMYVGPAWFTEKMQGVY